VDIPSGLNSLKASDCSSLGGKNSVSAEQAASGDEIETRPEAVELRVPPYGPSIRSVVRSFYKPRALRTGLLRCHGAAIFAELNCPHFTLRKKMPLEGDPATGRGGVFGNVEKNGNLGNR